VEAGEQRLEVETAAPRDHQFAVEHAARLREASQRLDDLGKVAGQGALVAAS